MRTILSAALVAGAALVLFSTANAASFPAAEVTQNVRHGVSRPLRDLARIAPAQTAGHRIVPLHRVPYAEPTGPAQPDGALQRMTGPRLAAAAGLTFEGISDGVAGFVVGSAPPDTNGAVGTTQYVEMVNSSTAVYNKATGALVLGPAQTNALWTGFGGGCETNNDGDPIVKFDRIANRWLITQFSVTTTPFLECVAVSQTDDATGVYFLYAFSYGNNNFNDYPKIGVWPDAYYVTYNIFHGNTFAGEKLCALNRTKMLVGAAAKQQCFQVGVGSGGTVLPSDLDGATAPPAGSPNYMVNFASNSLNLWKFHVDWATPANSSLSPPINIPVATFTPGGGTRIPQKGTTQKLDALGDRLMYRLAYRNFGDHESIMVNHSVKVGTRTGIRWYELRSPGGSPIVFQSGTFAPGTSVHRWMGSIAMDKVGNIAVGYSASSSTIHPGIRYTGRVPGDPLGTLESEVVAKAGGGSQLINLERWGDYSAMTVDPVDDCTFYYTSEYLKANGTFNWSTFVNTFKFSTCN